MLKHHMPNLCVKFEMSSFSHSGDILGGSKKLNGLRDHNHAPFGDDFYLFGKTWYSLPVHQIWQL